MKFISLNPDPKKHFCFESGLQRAYTLYRSQSKVQNSVSDPYSFDADPDKVLMTKNGRKKYIADKIFSFLFKNYNLPIPRPP
jgi:hypothetical protein